MRHVSRWRTARLISAVLFGAAAFGAVFFSAAAQHAAQHAAQDAAPDNDALCANPAAVCGRELSPACLQRLGAGAVAIGSDCAVERDAYRDCLARTVEVCGLPAPAPPPVDAACSAEDARQIFAALDQTNADDLRAFIAACPGSAQALLATSRLRRLEQAAASDARPAPSAPSTDQASLRRGAQVYLEVCMSCHDLGPAPVRVLADAAGPAFGPSAMDDLLRVLPDVPTAFDPLECVATATRARTLDDPLGGGFELPIQAEAVNNGFAPPLLVAAIESLGADEVVAILTGYDETQSAPLPPLSIFYQNAARPRGIAMPQPLFDDAVLYADGVPATIAQQARDVAAFLEWMAEASKTANATPATPAPFTCAPTPAPVREALRLTAKAEAGRGQSLFAGCRACHQFEPDGAHGVGPNLFGVFGDRVAAQEGFGYSDALGRLNRRGAGWTHRELIEYLYDPEVYAPGTSMRFRGVKEPQDLADLAAYLATGGRSPEEGARGGGARSSGGSSSGF